MSTRWSPADRASVITQMQLRLPPVPPVLRKPWHYRRSCRWWELEALRGYPSAEKSRGYAANMRWASELAYETGPGTWLELRARVAQP